MNKCGKRVKKLASFGKISVKNMRDEGKKLAVFGKLREKMRDEGEKLGRFGKCW